jgi:D-arabinose 1-dehydrogenase-like Zn-dependent alcohol dehydrogenase
MTVLVTAAAGGTGQFAVQLAKQAGCHVVATCSSESKAQLLRNLGADRVLNYKSDDLKAQLRRHYPKARGCGLRAAGCGLPPALQGWCRRLRWRLVAAGGSLWRR